jgi:DNA-binding beta-propeller fold protein YncE
VGLLDIDGQKVNYAQVDGKNYDMATGLNPLNVEITPDGKLAIVNNIGGGQDGQVDTVGVIDLEASPPRVIDQVVVGDGPEGLAISPVGGYTASLILNGTGGTPKTAFYRHDKLQSRSRSSCPPPTRVSSLLCAPGVISILRRHRMD